MMPGIRYVFLKRFKTRANGARNITEEGGVKFNGGASFETTYEALSELNGK